MAIMIAVIIVTIVYIVSIQSSALVSGLVSSEAKAANAALAKELELLKKEAFASVEIIALSPDVINAILNEDTAALKQENCLRARGGQGFYRQRNNHF